MTDSNQTPFMQDDPDETQNGETDPSAFLQELGNEYDHDNMDHTGTDEDEFATGSVNGGTARGSRGLAQSSVFLHLSDGFHAMRKRREIGSRSSSSASHDPIVRLERTQDFLCHANISVVDPSSEHQSPGGRQGANHSRPSNLFSRFLQILEEDYHAKLRNVPFQHFRSGVNGTIDCLQVKPYLSSSLGLLESDSQLPWAGAGPSGNDCDPIDWHCSPYCHVYIAPCSSLEDYRTKVKPSIQTFLSRIETSSRPNNANTNIPGIMPGGSMSGGFTPPQYVIVFVPCGGRGGHTEESGAGSQGFRLGGFASRVVGGSRNRLAQNMVRDLSAEANPANGGLSGDVDLDNDIEGQGLNNTPVGYLSKVDKEIFKRFVADFPRGKVCALSSLNSESDYEDDREVQRIEWGVFLTNLGSAVGSGFRERCGRYDVELRRLDALRGLAQAGVTYNQFDLAYFFLVKESLAFTCEQVSLPSEALIQYDEVDAILPDVNESVCKEIDDEYVLALADAAKVGDSHDFRKYIQLVKDLDSVAHLVQTYLFARVTSLLFKMNRSVEVLDRCYGFIKRMYDCKRENSPEDDKDARIKVEKWAYDFCTDVKKACDIYLTSDFSQSDSYQSSSPSETKRDKKVDEALARVICDILEFSRLRLIYMGDLALGVNPARIRNKNLMKIVRKPWEPWVQKQRKIPSGRLNLGNIGVSEHSTMIGSSQHSTLGSIGEEDEYSQSSGSVSLTGKASEYMLKSSSAFLLMYLDVVKILVNFNQFSGRKRCSARLCLEMADIYAERAEIEKAASSLKSALDIYLQDRWQACHFLVLFKLASYQREFASGREYLQTLVQCFNPLHAKSAPPKALSMLMDDLTAVLKKSGGPRHRLDSAAIFDPFLSLDGPPQSVQSGSDRGDLMKKVYNTGEMATMTLTLKSFLPISIEIDCVCIDLVPFREYMTAIEDSTIVRDETLYRVLTFEGPHKVDPGVNHFHFKWAPMVAGQFIMSSVTIHWSDVRFFYLAKSLRRPTIRVDVYPAEPSQSVQFTPEFLIPNKEQPLKIRYLSGKDVVKDLKLKLACSPGIMLLPPGETSDSGTWSSSTTASLPSCPPGESSEITVWVKFPPSEVSTNSSSDEVSQAITVSLSSLFRPPYPEDKECVLTARALGVDEEHFVNHRIDATVPTLDRQILTVEEQEVIPYSLDRAMLNITLRCNSPSPLIVKKWNLLIPSFMTLLENGDSNDFLLNARVQSCECLSLSFDCAYVDAKYDLQSFVPELTVEFCDQSGYSFSEIVQFELRRPSAPPSGISPHICIPMTLKPSVNAGPVGIPISILYSVGTDNLTGTGDRLCYEINADAGDWIISGKHQGIVAHGNGSNFTVELLAIPVRPGKLSRYPLLSIFLLRNESEESVNLSTSMSDVPGPFLSLACKTHSTIAVPMPPKKSL